MYLGREESGRLSAIVLFQKEPFVCFSRCHFKRWVSRRQSVCFNCSFFFQCSLTQMPRTKTTPYANTKNSFFKSPFKLQTRLSTAGTTLLAMPRIKNMIQRSLPIAEQRLGSDPVFSFCLLCFLLFLTDVTACDTGSLTRSAKRGECFKVWWPTVQNC